MSTTIPDPASCTESASDFCLLSRPAFCGGIHSVVSFVSFPFECVLDRCWRTRFGSPTKCRVFALDLRSSPIRFVEISSPLLCRVIDRRPRADLILFFQFQFALQTAV